MPSSTHSCKSTSTDNETFQDILHNDKVRYSRKGYGLLMALVLAFSYYFIFPPLAKPLYIYWMSLFSSQMSAFFWGNLLEHHFFFLTGNLVMLVIYKLELQFFERYKNNSQPWPWKANPTKFKGTIMKTVKALFINLMIVFPISVAVPILLGTVKLRFSAEEFPSAWELMGQIVFFMIVEDFSFYWVHRLLHHPKLYPFIHKKHHEYYTSISVASEYAHPLEFFLGNLTPTGLGPIILGSRVHFFTLLAWYIIRVMETIDGHCGYEFSWSPFRLLPLSAGAGYHDYHHSHNVGNYGSFFSVWDTLCGTNAQYFRFISIKQQEHDLREAKELLDQDFLAKVKTD
jgi:sterol desaturase/sphingolipid hydroxylase (fatty acid hydroxylase superfamily)